MTLSGVKTTIFGESHPLPAAVQYAEWAVQRDSERDYLDSKFFILVNRCMRREIEVAKDNETTRGTDNTLLI